MKKFIKTLGAVLTGMALVFGAVSCSPQIEYKTVEKKVYTCPNCGTEYESAEEAQNCCDVQYVTKFVCPECGTEYLKAEDAAACYASHKPVADTTAPSAVTSLTAINLDNAVALKWTDPTASDLFGIEITWTPQTVNASRAVAAMEANSLFVAPGKQIVEISNLKNGVEYTFTVKAMDTSGNKSSAKTVTIKPTEIAGSVLAITLTPATTTVTKEDYAVSVAVTTKEGRSIKKIKYAADSKELDYFASSGTTVTSGSFTVSSNGVYTVYAQDIDGRVGLKRITISNIDKTAPAKVTGLTAVYNFGEKKITLTWTDPTDTDFAKAVISYSKAGVAQSSAEVAKGTKKFELENIEGDNTIYTFEVKSIDNTGNESAAVSTSVETKSGPAVNRIIVDRNHLSYYEEDMTVNVTVEGFNFDKIAEQSDTGFKIQVVDAKGNLTNYDAVINVEQNRATAVISMPTTTPTSSSSSERERGFDYTVRVKLCGNIDNSHTATVNVSSNYSVRNVTLDTTQLALSEVTEDSKVHITITGTNLDLAKNAYIKLFDSTGAEYMPSTTAISTDTLHGTTMEADVKVPLVDDTYTINVHIGQSVEQTYKNLQIYDVPKFTSFTIPKAGTSKQDSKVTAVVKGKNFKAPGVTASSFNLSCASKPSITTEATVNIVNDSTLNIDLTIPGTKGTYDVEVSSGSHSKTETFVVVKNDGFATGDFILKDGSRISKDADLTEENKSNIVAIAAFIDSNGILYGIGFKNEYSYWWADSDYNKTNFEGITVKNKISYKEVMYADFSGDTDGSDNWEYIKSIDPTGTADAENNYPAFYFAENEYDTVLTGWYIPSIAELAEIYKNKDILNESLTKKSNFSVLLDSTYWSASQNTYGANIYTWSLNFKDGVLTKSDSRVSYNYVCCIRVFEF